MKSVGYLAAFIGGAFAGAALGILMAPEKGEDTRKKLTGKVKDFCDKHDIKMTSQQLKELVSEVEISDEIL